MQVGMTKDQGLYNKPSAAVHPGALAAGTLPQYNTIHTLTIKSFDRPTCFDEQLIFFRVTILQVCRRICQSVTLQNALIE